MSSIGATILPALAPAANATTQGSGVASREGGTSTSSTIRAPLGSQLATVVNLSADAKSRAASSGQGRKTDGAFEKQTAKGERSEKSNDSPARGRTLSVEA